jgi:hypothetical protein
MIPVLMLLAKQYVIVIVSITVYLLIARQISLGFYQSESLILLVILLTVFAALGAVQGVFVRPWWLYALASSILAFAWLSVMIDLIVPGTVEKMGAGGIVFLFPMLAFIFSYPLGGVMQWLLGLTQKRSS